MIMDYRRWNKWVDFFFLPIIDFYISIIDYEIELQLDDYQ